MSALDRSLEDQLENCAVYWESLGSEARGTGATPWFRSGARSPMLNGVRRSSATDVAAALVEVRRAMRGVPASWWVGPDSRPTTERDLVAAGLSVASTLPHLALDLHGSHGDRPRLDDLTVVEVTPETVHDWVAMWAPASGLLACSIDFRSRNAVTNMAQLPGYLPLAGYSAGELVGSVTALVRGDVAGLYAIATRPDRRRRGVGAAMTVAALDAARARGARVAALQSTSEGLPLYRGLGFRQVARYSVLPL